MKEAPDSFPLKPTCCPQRQPHAFCELWQSELALGSVSLCASAPPCACFTRARALARLGFGGVCFERGGPLPLLGFYIRTTWKPGALKIAQRLPIFFFCQLSAPLPPRVLSFSRAFPPECSGSAAATSCHMVPRRGCPPFFLNSLRRSQK